ncbi:MAG TPA: T9SS type A sorting domain-containing protein [Candidatus Kapabacteria bacterium]|nr:T9SS type A sorting domain-containing protein [Candidatus Kapabacteria bacterium]
MKGIRHEYSDNVTVQSYQYDVWDKTGTTNIGLNPPTLGSDEKIGLGFTVFGATATSSVKDKTNKNKFTITPPISTNKFTISIASLFRPSKLAIFDVIGRQVMELNLQPDVTHFEIETTSLLSGTYLCRLVSRDGTIEEAKFIVQH